jgi:hypothetical protein
LNVIAWYKIPPGLSWFEGETLTRASTAYNTTRFVSALEISGLVLCNSECPRVKKKAFDRVTDCITHTQKLAKAINLMIPI